MNPDGLVPWTTIIAIGTPVLAIFGSGILFLLKKAIKSTEKVYELRYCQLDRDLTRLIEAHDHLRDKLDRDLTGLIAAHDHLRDKWEEFLKEYQQTENTRNQKIDELVGLLTKTPTA